MDIFEYIDRVKANYSKQPEPRYNMKKYFIGGRVGFDKGGPAGYITRKQLAEKLGISPFTIERAKSENSRLYQKIKELMNISKEGTATKPEYYKPKKGYLNSAIKEIKKSSGIEAIKGPREEYRGKKTTLSQVKDVLNKSNKPLDVKQISNKLPDLNKATINTSLNVLKKDKNFKNKINLVSPTASALEGAQTKMIKNTPMMNVLRDVFVNNPDADGEEIARAMVGDKKFNAASLIEKEKLIKDANRQVPKFVSIFSKGAKTKIPGFKDINPNILEDILESIETRISDFGFEPGTRRYLQFTIADASRNLPEFSTRAARTKLMQKGKAVDEVAGVSATFDKAPGYIEATQVIDKNINKKKGKILDNQFSNTFKKTLEGDFSGVKEYNQKANAFAKKYKVDVPIIKTGNNLNPEKIISYFKNFSPGAQKNIKQIAKEKGVVIKTKSKPLFMKVTDAVENLPEDIQIKICNRLSSGGLPGDCANAIKKDPMKTSQIIVNETKDLKTAAGARALKAGRTLLKFGVVGEGAFIGADAGIRIYMGRPKNEAFLAATFREGKADDLRKKRAGLTDREFLVDKATDLESKKDSLQQEIGAANSMGDYYNEKDIDVLQKRLDKTIAELQKPIDKTGTRLVDLLDPGSATNISYQRKMDNIMDLDKAKSSQSRGFLRDVQEGIPNIADYGEIDAGVTKRTFAPRKAAAPMSTMDDYANQFDDEYLEEVRTKYKNPNITKKDILRAYREDENFNKGIFKSIFEEGLSSNANRERLLGTSGKFASGGMARASFGIGGFTKAQFIIQRMKNSLKQAFGKTDPDSKYVNETFPNMIKELEAKPELGNNENVFKMFSEDLPKNQKVVVHSDDSIDFFTQSDFGPQNIEPTIKFAEENNISIKEASRILKMEPEDQVLEKTRLQILKDKGRTRQASGGLTSLTRTIPPERGPNSQGLASFMKNGMK